MHDLSFIHPNILRTLYSCDSGFVSDRSLAEKLWRLILFIYPQCVHMLLHQFLSLEGGGHSLSTCPLGSLSYLVNQPATAPALTLTPSRFAELLSSCFRWLSAAVEGLSNAFQSYFENAKKKKKKKKHRCRTYSILTFCVGCCANFVRL